MKQTTACVSVVTSFFNDGAYIRDCVESVARSSYANVEHIIIDDGSTDQSSIDILSQIEAEYDVKVIRQANTGVCIARNRAVEHSSGRYILPLDADDMISEDYIALAVSCLDANKDVKLVATPYRYFGDREGDVELTPFSMETLLGHNIWVNCSMYRRADFDLKGGYGDYMIGGLEDWEFWIRLMKDGGEVSYLEGVHFFYRIKPQDESRNLSLSVDFCFDLCRKIWENNRDAFANHYPDPRCNFAYLDLVYRLNQVNVQQKSFLSRLWRRIKSTYRKK